MAKLKTERIIIYEKDADDRDMRDSKVLDFDITINVAMNGSFTTTLPEDVVKTMVDAGLKFRTNGIRGARLGFVQGDTLQELLGSVYKIAGEYVSKKLIEEKIIIRYIIETVCRYSTNGKDFIPYKNYSGKTKHRDGEGTVEIHAANPGTYGFRIWTEVVKRRKYRYASGTVKDFDDHITDHDEDDKPMLRFLTNIYCQKQARGDVMEMDYTEDAAAFFVDIYKAVFMINEKIKDRITPESIQSIIENKQKLLG